MKLINIYILSLYLLLRFSGTLAQDQTNLSYEAIRELAETKYGPDPDLLNGKKYNFGYLAAEGNPFYEDPDAGTCAIQIKGRLYEEQQIRFDIYRQLIVLDYIEVSGARGSIVLNDEWIDYFSIGKALFRKFRDKSGEERFGQAVYMDSISCVYFWKKNYISELKDDSKVTRFSKPIREAVIIRDGQTYGFKNKKSFLRCLPETDRKAVKAIMKELQLNPGNISDMQMEILMKNVNQIRGNDE